jgi:hypothetical protein
VQNPACVRRVAGQPEVGPAHHRLSQSTAGGVLPSR